MRRSTLRMLLCLILGAITTVAVAWGAALKAPVKAHDAWRARVMLLMAVVVLWTPGCKRPPIEDLALTESIIYERMSEAGNFDRFVISKPENVRAITAKIDELLNSTPISRSGTSTGTSVNHRLTLLVNDEELAIVQILADHVLLFNQQEYRGAEDLVNLLDASLSD